MECCSLLLLPSCSHSTQTQTLTPTPFSFPSTSLPLRRHTHTHFPTIRATITREKKAEIIAKVKDQLPGCHLIAGIRYKGLTCKQFETIRDSLPEGTKLLVAKNTLVFKAIEGTQFEALKPCMKGMNAYIFVHSEEIPDALKPYRGLQREWKLEDNDYIGAVFEGKFYPPEEFKFLENMPSRAEVYAQLLGAMQGPAISVVSTLQAPARNVLMVLQAYVKKLEAEAEAGGSSPAATS